MMKGLRQGQVAFLASVTSTDEARLALASGADIIDCKDPARGALGALPLDRVADIVAAVSRTTTVSATIGDLPVDPGIMADAALAIAGTGVAIVKVGFFGRTELDEAIAALGALDIAPARLVAVIMADQMPDAIPFSTLKAAGFYGVMLDTADKTRGALTTLMSDGQLASFLAAARAHGLVAGLAGSLRLSDIERLSALNPDILGFRGALCGGGRGSPLDANLVSQVRRELNAALQGRATSARSVA